MNVSRTMLFRLHFLILLILLSRILMLPQQCGTSCLTCKMSFYAHSFQPLSRRVPATSQPMSPSSAVEWGYLECCLFASRIELVMRTSRKRVPLLLMALEYTITAESLSVSVFRIDTVTKLTALRGIFGQISCIGLRKKWPNVSDKGDPLVFSKTINLLLLLPTEVESQQSCCCIEVTVLRASTLLTMGMQSV